MSNAIENIELVIAAQRGENIELVIAAQRARADFDAAVIACIPARRAYHEADEMTKPVAYAALTDAEIASCEAYRVYQDAKAAVIADLNKHTH
jgi:hypothetical protein